MLIACVSFVLGWVLLFASCCGKTPANSSEMFDQQRVADIEIKYGLLLLLVAVIVGSVAR